jgi:hypothetical protein
MTALPLEAGIPSLVVGGLALIAVIMRYSALLLGLLVALSKAAQSDCPAVFREFARTMRNGPEDCPSEIHSCSQGISCIKELR